MRLQPAKGTARYSTSPRNRDGCEARGPRLELSGVIRYGHARRHKKPRQFPSGALRLLATTRATVWGYQNSWNLAPSHRNKGPSQECEVGLEIQGDADSGFHLIMSPDGFFTTDSWHATKDEALETAERLFGVGRNNWVNSN